MSRFVEMRFTFGNLIAILAIVISVGGAWVSLSERVAKVEARLEGIEDKVADIKRYLAPPMWGSR